MDCQRLVDSSSEPRFQRLPTLPLAVEALRAALGWLSATAREPNFATVLSLELSPDAETIRAYDWSGRVTPSSVPGVRIPIAACRKVLSSFVALVNASRLATLCPP